MTNETPLYACLYVREFPAQTLLRHRPELHDAACVVMSGEAPSEKVCSLNTKARLSGIKHGMSRVEIETFANPIVMRRSVAAENITKAACLEIAGSFSPRVEDRSEDTAYLCGIDIVGTRSLFGPPEQLGKRLLAQIRAFGMSANIAISKNFHTAVCLAKSLSRRGTVQIVESGEEANALSFLPMTVLDLSDAQLETFTSWGIYRLGQLSALPEKGLISRMGQEGNRLRQMAAGLLPHHFQAVEPPFRLEDRLELDAPLDVLESLLFGIAMMLDQLIARVSARVLALACVTVTLDLEGDGTHERTVRPALPTNDKELWIKLIHLDLEAHPPQAAILAVGLRAEPGSTSKVQLGLFTPQLPEASRLDITLARLSALVGECNVGSPALPDQHRPGSFRIEPFVLPSGDPSNRPTSISRVSLRQLRPPEPVMVTLKGAKPEKLRFRTRRYVVENLYGPWLASGAWWNRDRYGLEQWDLDARSEDGSILCCCVTRDRVRNRWQMAALYD
ncbi:DNA polymerase Y family protein [Tunturiibacter lichenicola]|uniref:DNA polymerase Y family protein n=1 Tax=Tunturiibacter lichenicola TaxID=2051959 RepID=UPI0021B2AD97|nr:DNA polymerase Y family protein [Edaphobacter lichenicola]